jgi:redox-sensing transcriptional repressor
VPRKNNHRGPSDQVSDLTAGRLSVYLRSLNVLAAAGVKTVSSKALAEQFHLNAAQIRKDLAYFGEFGIRGVGYYVTELRRQLRVILGLDRPVRVAVIGAGNLGMALADYPGFRREGFVVVSMFDVDRAKVGRKSKGGVPIRHVDDFAESVKEEGIDIAVIAVPDEAAQPVADLVVSAGIRAVLNFSPGSPRVPASVKLKNVDLTVSMESLSFFLARGDDGQP